MNRYLYATGGAGGASGGASGGAGGGASSVTAVAQAVTALFNMIGNIKMAKAVIEQSKSALQKDIEAVCGDEPKFCWTGRQACDDYDNCIQDFVDKKYALEKEYLRLQNEELRLTAELQNKQLELERLKTLQSGDSSKNKTILYVVGGVVVLIGGLISIFYITKK
jgi:chromosome segregation ATPase